MSITYQIDPVLEAVRSFVDTQLTAIGMPAKALPLLTAIAQYPIDITLLPLTVFEPVATSADWRQFAAGDVTLTVDLNLHHLRLRSGTVCGEETAAVGLLSQLATAFATDYRLGGDVQAVVVESIAIAEPDSMHRLGIPIDEHILFAAATMKLRVVWIESCFEAA